jgi:hypothetical protein
MTRICLVRPTAIARQGAGPNPIEYVFVFLVVVAGILAMVR